jgi:hypothetical protein
MAQLNQSILKVIAYFDTFSYPVTLEEINIYLDQPAEKDTISFALQSLLDKQLIWKIGEFYTLKNDPDIVLKRLNGNMLAVKKLKNAMKLARVLSWFPYIRGVAISGSLSKNLAYKGSDYDFFIITATNRLWLIRTFLLMLIRVFSFIGAGSICLNYFIDDLALEVEEKNIFTAIEIVTLMPVHGLQIFQRFFSTNGWITQYLPNSHCREMPSAEMKDGWVKRSIEWMLNNRLGDNMDNWLLGFFSRRWSKILLLKKPLPNGFLRGAIVAEKHCYKPTPHDFQQKILSRFQERMDYIKAQYELTTSSLVK